MQKTRVLYLDLLKILAILFVLFNHTYWFVSTNNAFVSALYYGMFYICKIAVPLFLMVTGALLLGKTMTYKESITKRAFRVIVPLLFVTFIFVIFNDRDLSLIFKRLFVTCPFWLWYLYLLIGLYVVTPFLQKMIKNFTDKDYKYFIFLFVGVVGCINLIPNINHILFFNPVGINGDFSICLFPIAIGYYVTGYYLSKKEISSKLKNFSIVGLILCIIFGILYLRFGYHKGLEFDRLITYSDIIVAIPTIFTFIIFKYYFAKIKFSPKVSNFITAVSNSVFGVYLFHVFVINFLHNTSVMKAVANYNTFVEVSLLCLITFIFLTFIVWLLRKVPWIRKFL